MKEHRKCKNSCQEKQKVKKNRVNNENRTSETPEVERPVQVLNENNGVVAGVGMKERS